MNTSCVARKTSNQSTLYKISVLALDGKLIKYSSTYELRLKDEKKKERRLSVSIAGPINIETRYSRKASKISTTRERQTPFNNQQYDPLMEASAPIHTLSLSLTLFKIYYS